MRIQLILVGLLMVLGLAGCAYDDHSAATTQPHAECLVCKMNVDLACVDVPLTKETPTVMYLGKTYYFCSDECRDKFLKDPAKYAK